MERYQKTDPTAGNEIPNGEVLTAAQLERKSQMLWEKFILLIENLINSNPNFDEEVKQFFLKNHLNPNLHSPDWHRYDISIHIKMVHYHIERYLKYFKSIKLYLESEKNIVLQSKIQKILERSAGRTNIESLFKHFAAWGHDLGKYAGSFQKVDKNGNKVYTSFQMNQDESVVVNYPSLSFSGHEKISGEVILNSQGLAYYLLSEKIKSTVPLNGEEIKVIADLSRFHFELGILRNIGKKHNGGILKYVESEKFKEDLLAIFKDPEKRVYALEIILFFIADNEAKLTKKDKEIIMNPLSNLGRPYTQEDIDRQEGNVKKYLNNEIESQRKKGVSEDKITSHKLVNAILQYPQNLIIFRKALKIWDESTDENGNLVLN